MKFKNWIQKKDKRSFIIRDWISTDKNFYLGDATLEEDNYKMFAVTLNGYDWRYASLDVFLFAMCELYGKDYVKQIIEMIQPYEKIKEVEISNLRSDK